MKQVKDNNLTSSISNLKYTCIFQAKKKKEKKNAFDSFVVTKKNKLKL